MTGLPHFGRTILPAGKKGELITNEKGIIIPVLGHLTPITIVVFIIHFTTNVKRLLLMAATSCVA